MKKLIITISVILQFSFFVENCICQWIKQYPYTLGLNLRDVEFINQNTGWICGDGISGNGIILKTTNMGVNWIAQNHPATNKYLFSIHPVDSNIVYCIGWFETVLKTTNGGTNWFALKNGPVGQGYGYEGLFFINANTGWYAGTGNHIHKTTNGGFSFDSVYVLGDFKDIHFKDSNTGLIVGGGGSVYKTTNGGIIWNQVYLPPNNYGDFRKISVINNQYCFAAEDGKRVYKSTNYGDSWDSIGYVTGANHPFNCRFSSLNTGWVGGSRSEIFKSTNGGATWNKQYINTTSLGTILSMWFYNDYTGWATGGNGNLFFTSSGGATFAENIGNELPDKYILYQNYPNPFNNETVIEYEIPQRSFVNITIYDALGREVAVILNDIKATGKHSIRFNANELPSGVYFAKMLIENKTQKIKSMILIK